MNIFQDNPELGEHWFRDNTTMMIISGLNGEIYDANNEFLEFIGYSLYEFQKEEHPVTWFDITIKDDDLAADQFEADQTMKGLKRSYNVRKHYIPKQSLPKLVNLHASRYPPNGGIEEFKFFLVEVYNLTDTTKEIYKEIDKINNKTTQSLVVINETLQKNTDVLDKTTQCLDNLSQTQSIIIDKQIEMQTNAKSYVFEAVKGWVEKNPKLFSILVTFAIILLSTLLFGERAIEIFTKIYNLITGNL